MCQWESAKKRDGRDATMTTGNIKIHIIINNDGSYRF